MNMNIGVILNCLLCDKILHRKGSKFCNNKCRGKWLASNDNPARRRKIISCKECGKEKEIHNYMKSVFCSKDCSAKYHIKFPTLRNNIPKIKKICTFCSKEFEVWNYRATALYCSRECHYLNGRITRTCDSCKKEYITEIHKNKRYCSNQCANQGIGKRKSKFAVDINNFLIDNNYSIIPEKTIRLDSRWLSADFLINDNIILECNGDYWHCNPKKYSKDYIHAKIRKTAKQIWEHDLLRKTQLENNGFVVITTWEDDWNNDSDFFKNLKIKIDNEICKN